MTTRTLLITTVVFMPLLSQASSLSVGTSFAGIGSTGWVPPDMGFAVGQSQIVEVVNGGYEVFNKLGGSMTGGQQSDVSLWTNAGIPVSQVTGQNNLSDPRVMYDPGSNRFFVSEINATSANNAGNSNMAFIAVSNSSGPTPGWNAVGFVATTGMSNGFADFDTLGLDKNGVYLGTNNFNMGGSGPGGSISVFSMPKSDLLLGTPSIANLTAFTSTSDGIVPHPAYDPNGTYGEVISQMNQGTYDLLQLGNTANHPATLTVAGTLNGVTDNGVVYPTQSDGSIITNNIDDRISSTPFIVGNLMYAVNSFADPTDTFDVLHWMIIDVNTNVLLQQGTISNPNFDYTYPSVAANANGDFVIGFDRSGSGPQGNIESWAVACHYNGTSASCDTPLELSAGDNTVVTDGRMGDFTATNIDPTNPDIFWTSSEVPSNGTWGTHITELILTPDSVPEPGTFVLAGALIGGLLWRRRLNSKA